MTIRFAPESSFAFTGIRSRVINHNQQVRNRRRTLGSHLEASASNQVRITTGTIQNTRRVIQPPLRLAPLTVPLRAGSIQQSLS